MDRKRLELYVGWTCNQRCTYCVEFPNMEKAWKNRVTTRDILKKLILFKKQWYNHVTYLWWEPFIQPVFLDALKIGKMLWYTILVTTNASTLHLEKQAKKFLPYIDELFLSVQAIDKDTQQKMSRTNSYAQWEEVFKNIREFWKWDLLKANIVITKDNLSVLKEIVKYLGEKWVTHMSLTYPDIRYPYYSIEHIHEKIAPRYSECMEQILPILDYCRTHKIRIKLPDFPFCVFPRSAIAEYIPYTDDYDYWIRIKVSHTGRILNRENLKDKPRIRSYSAKCTWCIYKNKCWWHSEYYEMLYWLEEITALTHH